MPMIEEGKFYQARKGIRLGPARPNKRAEAYPWLLALPTGEAHEFTAEGRFFANGPDSSLDLISGWVDAPDEADADGWARWDGDGPCPLSQADAIEVRYRDGETNATFNPFRLDWRHRGSRSDIIAYRVVVTGRWAGANAHGIGPDTDGGPNPDFEPLPMAYLRPDPDRLIPWDRFAAAALNGIGSWCPPPSIDPDDPFNNKDTEQRQAERRTAWAARQADAMMAERASRGAAA